MLNVAFPPKTLTAFEEYAAIPLASENRSLNDAAEPVSMITVSLPMVETVFTNEVNAASAVGPSLVQVVSTSN